MAIIYMKTVAAACILSFSGDRSFDTVTLKESATEYASGEIVVAEYAAGAPTGKFVKASTVTTPETYEPFEIGFVVRNTDASEADVQELVVNADAEIRIRDTNFDDLGSPVRFAVESAAKLSGIKLR